MELRSKLFTGMEATGEWSCWVTVPVCSRGREGGSAEPLICRCRGPYWAANGTPKLDPLAFKRGLANVKTFRSSKSYAPRPKFFFFLKN